MKSREGRPQTLAIAPCTLYRFRLGCTFEVQFSFDESEVETDPEGDETDVEPTGAALVALNKELTEWLNVAGFAVHSLMPTPSRTNSLVVMKDGTLS